MRIGIDARELCGKATGAGRYLGGLLREWAGAALDRRHDWVLYAPEPLHVAFDTRRFATRLVSGAPGIWWEQMQLPRAVAWDHLDVFFAPAYTAPLRLNVPCVLAVHDLSFAAHPEWFRMREGMRRRWLTRHGALRARAVVTISEFSKGEIVERLGVPENRIQVIPPGITAPAIGDPTDRSEPRVLFVGSIFNRRHVPDLIRVFGRLASLYPDLALDIVGDNRSYPREDVAGAIRAEGLENRACWHAYVSDDELRRLYRRARAFAFLSEYEGLGLTPLEALAAGIPPLLADTPVARESCGAAALYVPSGDVRAAADALERLLFDNAVRARLLGAAPAALGRYCWARAARETLALIERSA